MKKLILLAGGLQLAIIVSGQQEGAVTNGCSCPACSTKAAGETWTLPGLKGFDEQDDFNSATVERAEHEHQDQDVAAEGDHDHADHGHDHGGDDHDMDAEDGHDAHGDEEALALKLPAEISGKIGLQVHEATGGMIERTVVFPAEIKLNRDRAAAVSPRYAAIVRKVHAEIGDRVRKGDVLASLENRETMAVYTITAPLDGTVVTKTLSAGETAGEDEVLFEVADLSTVWADISIFPQYRHHVRKGQRVMLTASDGHGEITTIQYISPLVSTETRTLQARCVLENAGEDFTPGAFVRAAVIVETAGVEVRVEKEAVQVVDGRPVVFVAGEHGFEARDVVPGRSDRSFVEIRSGLKPGEPYVAHGAFELKAELVTSGLDPHAGHGH